MMVEFPAPEPWPAELFEQYGIRDLEALIDGARAAIEERRSAALADEARCDDCGEIVHRSETTCASCGSHLNPKNSTGDARIDLDGQSAGVAERRTIPMVKDCTCGDAGICTACVLAEYDGDLGAHLMVTALDATKAALARPANVVPLHHGHSMRVSDRDARTNFEQHEIQRTVK